jgi:hypothetical protein
MVLTTYSIAFAIVVGLLLADSFDAGVFEREVSARRGDNLP